MNRYWLLLLLILSHLGNEVAAQSPFLINYTTKHGLPSNECYDLIQDSTGFIWIGTDRGLARFDGSNFKLYSTQDGLHDNLITGIFLDRENNIWCNSYRKGITQFVNGIPQTPDWFDQIGKAGPYTDDIVFDKEKGIFLTFNRNMNSPTWLMHIDSAYTISEIPLLDSSNSAIRIIQEGTSIGFASYRNPESALLKFQSNKRRTILNYESSKPAGDGIISSNEKAYISFRNTLISIVEGVFESSFEFESGILNSLMIDKDGGLWVGTLQNGCFYFKDGDLKQRPEQFLIHHSVTSIIQDDMDGYWFSTIESGIYHLPYSQIKIWNTNTGLPEKRITGANITDSTIWLFFRNGSICAIDRSSNAIIPSIQTNLKYVFSQFIDLEGVLHISTLEPNAHPDLRFSDYKIELIRPYASMRQLSDSSIIRARIDGNIEVFKDDVLIWDSKESNTSCPRANVINEFSDSIIYLGTIGGLYSFDRNEVKPCFFGIDLLKQSIQDIESYNGNLLVSVSGMGLIIIQDNKIVHLSNENVLSSNFIQDIHVHDGKVWLAAAKGIDYFDWNDMFEVNSIHANHIGLEKGLPNLMLNEIGFVDDAIWTMTDDGLASIPLDILLSSNSPPALTIQGIQVNGIDVNNDKLEALDHSENNVQIAFQAIDYNNQSSLIYYYRLMGSSDTVWTSTRTKTINYASLTPGDYRLQLKTSLDGVNFSEINELSVYIAAPFWKRWYVLLPVALAILVLTYYLLDLRIRNIRYKEEVDRKIERLSLQALHAQMNPHFIFNALNAIQNFIVQENKAASINYLGQFSALIRSIFENSTKAWVDLESELKTITLYAELELARYPEKFKFTCENNANNSNLKIPPMIIQPFVENAILHGILPCKKSGNVAVRIKQSDDHLRIEIEDDGVGLNQGEKNSKMKSKFLEHYREKRSHSGMSVTKARIIQIAKKHHISPDFSATDIGQNSSLNSTGTLIRFNLPFIA